MKTLTVSLGERSYPILIGSGLLDRAGDHFAEYLGAPSAAVITDDHVAPLYLSRLESALRQAGIRCCAAVLPHGEPIKCLQSLSHLYDFLAENRITRSDAIIVLGGGVMGDLGGLAAATWLRGIRFMQIPTTLLAQVDSSVGGKVAVDLPQGKNLVGAFHQPSCVLIDPDTLDTLTPHFWQDGLGEVIKYGCILDSGLFSLLEKAAPAGREGLMAQIDEILTRCVRAKADVVSRDEHDTGLRMILNFGHTVGHAIEVCQRYNGLSHGQAVAAGMAVITRIAQRRGCTEAGTAERLEALENICGLPTAIPAGVSGRELLAAMGRDKKNLGKKLNLILLKRIGESVILPADASFFEDALNAPEGTASNAK